MAGDNGGYKVIPMDRNNTREKVLAGLESLADQSAETYLKETFEKAKRQVELKGRVGSRKVKRIRDKYVK